MRRPVALQAEHGLAGWEALLLGVLVFVVGTLLVVNIWAVVDAKMAATAAAREGARAFVLADDAATGAAHAHAAAAASLEGHGWAPGAAELALQGDHERCARARMVVALKVQPLALPLGGLRRGVTTRAAHTERVDPLRGGLVSPANGLSPGRGERLCS